MDNIKTFERDMSHIKINLGNKNKYSLEVTLTNGCNFKCDYCFEGDKCDNYDSLDCVDRVLESIDNLLCDQWFLSTFSGIHLSFWGGEPTLRPDLLEVFANRYGKNHLVTFHMYTNGYHIDDTMRIFGPYKGKTNIQVSYDGKAIHDIKRRDKFGNTTSDTVKSNIYELYHKGFNVSLKSTVTPDTIKYMPSAWDDIKEINLAIGDKAVYAPTIDTSCKSGDINIEEFKATSILLAKKELGFFRETGKHLLTWFDSDQPTRCSAISGGMMISTTGDMLYCHGCEYSSLSDHMRFGNIKTHNILDGVKYNLRNFKTPEVIEGCEGCISTYCCTCNVVKYEKSGKESFHDRWWDLTCQKNQCDMFRTFGLVSMSLRQIKKGV